MRGIARARHAEQGSRDDGQESREAEGCRFLEEGLDETQEEDAVEQAHRIGRSGNCPKRRRRASYVGGTPESRPDRSVWLAAGGGRKNVQGQ